MTFLKVIVVIARQPAAAAGAGIAEWSGERLHQDCVRVSPMPLQARPSNLGARGVRCKLNVARTPFTDRALSITQLA